MDGTVSLPEHLHASLFALFAVNGLPGDLSNSLAESVKPRIEDSALEVPTTLLRKTARWTQTAEGKAALRDKGLNPSDYLMISLLAGTTALPSAKLAPYVPPLTPEQEALRKSKERKAISALINGVLSVVGVGIAVWWAGANIGMRPDYKVLLSVFSAIVVAATEALLFWIWQWRHDTELHKSRRRLVGREKRAADKEPMQEAATETIGSAGQEESLRRRVPQANSEDTQ